VRRADIEALYGRIDAHEDDACRGDDPQFEKRSSGSRGFVTVEVRLRDGRSQSIRVDKAPGAPSRDLSWEEMHGKFMDCARSARLPDERADRAFTSIQALDRAADIRKLVDLMR
jgi:2-methylcitrate dehydratase PrpD